MKFGYFYGRESEQFTFYRIPKTLITAPEFTGLSDSAKILYGLMLDRMGLSIKNGWFDEQNRAYIIFTIEEVKEYMNCKDAKAVKLMKELDSKTGVGLIDRIKHGQGKPAVIYVKKFLSSDDEYENSSMPKNEKQEFQKEKNKTFENRNSRVSQTESADFHEPQCSYNNINNTKNNDTECSNINPINRNEAVTDNSARETAVSERWIDRYNKTVAEIKEQIDYDYLIGNNERKLVDEVVEIMADVMTVYRAKYKIEGEYIDCDTVIHKFRKVTAEQIEVFLLEFAKLHSTIHNPKSYVITALYNMPLTSNLALSNMVNTNLYGGGSYEQ